MKIINASIQFDPEFNGISALKKIEKIGRVCYKSEDKITENSYLTFVENIIKRGHESVLEHVNVTIRIITDRGVSHELVRHRLASYSQESTRYCNYKNKDIEFVVPIKLSCKTNYEVILWQNACLESERYYNLLIAQGASPQIARSVLNNSVKTEVVMTANLREWRHFLKLRTDKAAHPDMQVVARLILNQFKRTIPIVFDDINGGN